MERLFVMTMLVELKDIDTSLDETITGLKRTGEEIPMGVSVRLHGAPERRRTAALVSKEPHCLERPIEDIIGTRGCRTHRDLSQRSALTRRCREPRPAAFRGPTRPNRFTAGLPHRHAPVEVLPPG